jgi:hypothetical protein
MFTPGQSARQELDGGLVLRALETDRDVEKLADFNGQVHDPPEVTLTRRLVRDHPHTSAEHWLIVEDPATSRIVSTLCLIPWRLRLGPVEFSSGEMGIVGTHTDYRRRGLIRALATRFDDLLARGGFLMSHIQGIPGFYGHFGYTYAVPLIPDLRVTLETAAAAAKGAEPLEFRVAEPGDIPLLETMHARMTDPLSLTSLRGPDVWRYLLEGPTVDEGETWLFWRKGHGEPQGYFRVHKTGFGDGVNMSEAALPGAWAAGSLLGRLAEIASRWKRPYVKLEMDPECDLAVLARDLGGQQVGHYAWQVRLPDPGAFLQKVAPVLSARLAGTMFSDLTERVPLTDYRSEWTLVFEGGKMVGVDKRKPRDEKPVRIPPPALVPLLLGYRSMDELAATHHDFGVPATRKTLIRLLFPRSRSHLYTIY